MFIAPAFDVSIAGVFFCRLVGINEALSLSFFFQMSFFACLKSNQALFFARLFVSLCVI